MIVHHKTGKKLDINILTGHCCHDFDLFEFPSISWLQDGEKRGGGDDSLNVPD